MAEDKRVAKTKRNLKETMIELLQEMPFEKITVTELCRRGETSRITFYTYYEDKYALVNEMFADYIQEADQNYHDLQARNNPGGDGFIGTRTCWSVFCSFFITISGFSPILRRRKIRICFPCFSTTSFSVLTIICSGIRGWPPGIPQKRWPRCSVMGSGA